MIQACDPGLHATGLDLAAFACLQGLDAGQGAQQPPRPLEGSDLRLQVPCCSAMLILNN